MGKVIVFAAAVTGCVVAGCGAGSDAPTSTSTSTQTQTQAVYVSQNEQAQVEAISQRLQGEIDREVVAVSDGTGDKERASAHIGFALEQRRASLVSLLGKDRGEAVLASESERQIDGRRLTDEEVAAMHLVPPTSDRGGAR